MTGFEAISTLGSLSGYSVAVGNFQDIRAIVGVSDKLRTQRSMVADPTGAAWSSPALTAVRFRCK